MWEGTGGVGEAGGRRVWAPQGHSTLRAGAARLEPILTRCGRADGGRGGSAETGLCEQGWHRAGTPSWGRVCGKEVESRRVVMLGWRGERG